MRLVVDDEAYPTQLPPDTTSPHAFNAIHALGERLVRAVPSAQYGSLMGAGGGMGRNGYRTTSVTHPLTHSPTHSLLVTLFVF